MKLAGWVVRQPNSPMILEEREEHPGPGDVVVEVAGCGVCHTDLAFFEGGVATRHQLPLTLGHEISGRVVETGAGAESWLGERVVVAAVIPCGDCDACRAGRGSVCPRQIFPGNDVHGGFATAVRVPARGLCTVPELDDGRANPLGLDLPALSVIADAVSTPYQAIARSGLAGGDLAVVVGVGGIGSFAVQLAATAGAHVVAIDVDQARLDRIAPYGASLTLRPDVLELKELRRAVRAFGDACGVPTWRTHIFEMSGTPAGQLTAFSLLGPGSVLSVVGFTPASVELRLSNLMAFDAVARGNWGCLPAQYPAVVDLVLSGKVHLTPFLEQRSLSRINETFEELHHGALARRVVLVP